jgi:hypothetical protein
MMAELSMVVAAQPRISEAALLLRRATGPWGVAACGQLARRGGRARARGARSPVQVVRLGRRQEALPIRGELMPCTSAERAEQILAEVEQIRETQANAYAMAQEGAGQ